MHSRHLVKLLGLAMLAAASLMAVSASAAQAKFLLLLNGTSVSSLNFKLEFLLAHATAENGLKITCSGGSGESQANLSKGGEKLTGNPSGTFTGCVWSGQEKTCIINDGGAGNIKLIGNDNMTMASPEEYRLTGTSEEFGTVITEGAFCTIPEEESISGTASALVLDALADTKVKLAHFNADNIKLGNSKLSKVAGTMHVSDKDNPNATFGIHLVEL